MSLITCKNLSLGYDGRTVVKDVSFQVNQGDYICIAGENGSGKTTLIKSLLGLLKPLSGEILYSKELKNATIGYLPQQTAAQKDFPASAFEVVLSGCVKARGILPFYSKREKKLALQNMERLQINDLKNECYRNLSGGQQQRVLLARALCATDQLLILDEPVTGLDPTASAELYELIHRLNNEYHVTILMVSHDIGCATNHATKIMHIGNKLLFYGTVKEYFSSEVGKQFLGGLENHD